jgi:mRNA interferase RelE/StbE
LRTERRAGARNGGATKDAAKVLKTMARDVAATIQAKIKGLANDPYSAANVKKLTGRDGYRLRVGDWRVLLEINDGKVVILVLAVKPRGGA